MKQTIEEQFSGKGKLGLLRPSFAVNGVRFLIRTLFSDRHSGFYDANREADRGRNNVVVLPGFAGDIGPYQGFAERLGKTMNVYAPSTLPRGIGAVMSSRTIEDQARLVLDFLDKLPSSDSRKTDIVGHSNGGLTALLALRLSETVYGNRHRIGRIVTIASGLRPPEKNYFGSIPFVSSHYGAIRDLSYNSPLFSAISPYYGRVSMSLVSEKDQLFSPEMMYTDRERAKFYPTDHYGFFHGRHIGQTVSDINSALV